VSGSGVEQARQDARDEARENEEALRRLAREAS
jgi:hypothetical protein